VELTGDSIGAQKLCQPGFKIALPFSPNLQFVSLIHRRSVSETSFRASRPELHRVRRKINSTAKMGNFREMRGSRRSLIFDLMTIYSVVGCEKQKDYQKMLNVIRDSRIVLTFPLKSLLP